MVTANKLPIGLFVLCALPRAFAAASAAQNDARLLDAVRHRDHQAVRSLLVAHVDVNAPQPDGATPLAWAVHLGDGEMADALLLSSQRVEPTRLKAADYQFEYPELKRALLHVLKR